LIGHQNGKKKKKNHEHSCTKYGSLNKEHHPLEG